MKYAVIYQVSSIPYIYSICLLSAFCLPFFCLFSAFYLPFVCLLSAFYLPFICLLSAFCLPVTVCLSKFLLELLLFRKGRRKKHSLVGAQASNMFFIPYPVTWCLWYIGIYLSIYLSTYLVTNTTSVSAGPRSSSAVGPPPPLRQTADILTTGQSR